MLYIKDPDDILDYGHDFGGDLAVDRADWDGDDLATVTVELTVADGTAVNGTTDLEVSTPVAVSTGTGAVVRYAVVWLAKGVVGKTYLVRYRGVSTSGRQIDHTDQVRIVQR